MIPREINGRVGVIVFNGIEKLVEHLEAAFAALHGEDEKHGSSNFLISLNGDLSTDRWTG